MHIKNAHQGWSYLAQSQKDPSVPKKVTRPCQIAFMGTAKIDTKTSPAPSLYSTKNVFLINHQPFDTNSTIKINNPFMTPTVIHAGVVKIMNAVATINEIISGHHLIGTQTPNPYKIPDIISDERMNRSAGAPNRYAIVATR